MPYFSHQSHLVSFQLLFLFFVSQIQISIKADLQHSRKAFLKKFNCHDCIYLWWWRIVLDKKKFVLDNWACGFITNYPLYTGLATNHEKERQKQKPITSCKQLIKIIVTRVTYPIFCDKRYMWHALPLFRAWYFSNGTLGFFQKRN